MKKYLFCCALIYLSINVFGQQSLPYFCGFETDEESAGWELNTGATDAFENLWCIGSAAYRSGVKGMYISPDNGNSAGYSNTRNMLVASREFHIPQGTYLLSFDWRAMGTSDSTAVMYVCWMPATISTSSTLSSTPPDWVLQRKLSCSGETVLWGASSWRNEQVTLQTNGNPYKLVFVWVNATSDPVNPGACIDNVQMTTIACPPPENLQLEQVDGTVTFKWEGNANSYSLRYNVYGQDFWAEVSGLTTTEYSVSDLENGVYSFWVQGNCDNDTSIWSESGYYLVYDLSAVTSCINYMDLDNAQCWIGDTSDPYVLNQKVDYGFAAKESRHTIHYLPDEYDPRTDGMLKTVPDGVLASVRLGNWASGGEAEAIEYEYYVEEGMNGVLLLKYAVVLENPSHDETDNPRFKLEILKSDGQPVDKLCASADFSASDNLIKDGWQYVGSNEDIVWKDWTTIGVNLLPYEGDTLTIRLTSYDCVPSAHYGYAYFTLDCADGEITGISCGGNPTDRFKAPDGFLYRWYKTDNPDKTLGESQEYPTPPAVLDIGDVSSYSVDCIYPEAEQCYFTLSASAKRRDPVADIDYVVCPQKNCKNEVQFINNSFVLLEGEVSDMKCESMLWEFGDPNGTTSTSYEPTFTYPDEGGEFVVSVTAFISDEQCDSTISFTINLPHVGDTTDTLEVNTCKDYYVFDDETLVASGEYTKTYTTSIGCDSVVVLKLNFVEAIEEYVVDTICSDEFYSFGSEMLNQSGEYSHVFTNSEGCDSIVKLTLTVLPKPEIENVQFEKCCAGDSEVAFSYNLLGGVADFYQIIFSAQALEAGFVNTEPAPISENLLVEIPQKLVPGDYNAYMLLGDAECGSDTMPVEISVLYPDSIIVQRWDDILSVTNADWNGGYEFSAYQWYKNGNPLEGQTHSYLYLPEEKLDVTAEYSVLLTRADDGKSVMTCSYIPHEIGSEEKEKLVIGLDNISYNGQGVELQVSSPARIRLYNAYGVLVSGSQLSSSGSLPLPDVSGMYILEATSEEGVREVYRIIVK